MKTFLQETAQAIVNTTNNYKNTVCVVPSERAGIYLKNAFKEKLVGTVSFLPKIISIEKFIKEISGFEAMDQVSLLFEFFKIYKQENKKKDADTFEQFISWATIIIQDFNEIDRHLVNAEHIFSYLTDIQKIKDWSPTEEEVTDTVKNYMSFVGDLYPYYQELNKVLLTKKAGYQGLVYKQAYLNHQEYLKEHQYNNFHFIGFNALNKAEEEIFKSFLSLEQNHIYWDADDYYINSEHEAGTFMRKFFKEWDCLQVNNRKSWINHHFKHKKNIQILGSPLNVTGIKAVTSLLETDMNPKETALVLAEETILPVVLNSIPPSVNKVNITMGYQLSNIPLSGLFQSVFELHLNKEKLGKNTFYYKDIMSFLRHPYITKITKNNSEKVIKTITNNNLVFLSKEQIQSFLVESNITSNVFLLFDEVHVISVFVEKIIQFIHYLDQELDGIELLYVEGFRKVFQEIETLNATYEYINNVKVLYKIFKKILPLESIDFRGEALEGMQLMGMLETRCLDFKNVIITSVNEGVLPTGSSERSFISFEVKKQFNMPTYLAKDAIFSYHFYRLIQRAENVYLLYNTKSDDFGGGEMSRFLTQLMIDKEESVHHRNIVAAIHNTNKVAVEIEKTPRVMELLQSYFKKGASPSRIADYINDPLTFYNKMVLKIKETDKVEEEVAHNTLGTVVHDSLELLYTPYIGKILIAEDLKKMKSESNATVELKFKEYFKEGDIRVGKNKLISEVAKQFVLNFLNKELNEINTGKEIIVKDLEGDYNVSITTPMGHQISLKGKIDRVDEVDGVRRIVDYKTGKVMATDLKLGDLTLVTTDAKYNKIVQVMTYVLLYTSKHQFDLDKQELQTGIYSFKNFKEGFLGMNFSTNSRVKDYRVTKASLEEFKQSLLALIDEILDNKTTFVENLDNPYKLEA
ncbi:PD-(D/E)XK nuclease family protein [Wenyingzhuangia sp. IMCC45467]